MNRLQPFLDRLVAGGELSAVTALVGTVDGIVWSGSSGVARSGSARPAGPETRYDLASITKPFLATLALRLDAEGRLPLDLPLGDVLPAATPRLARRPLSDLLRHRAGVAAWAPLYVRCRSLAEVEALLLGDELPAAPAGTYSDLDFILWSLAATRRLGRPLPELLREEVLAPLGLATVEILPGVLPERRDRPELPELPEIAESRMGTGQEVALARGLGLAIDDLGPPAVGQPQDGNTRFLSRLGLALPGPAGLFGRAEDLFRLGMEWLRPGALLQPEGVAAALAGGGGPFALGWWRRRRTGGGGPALSRRAFGHTGFAGGNVWMDPGTGSVMVLLGHRLRPDVDFNRHRRHFNTLAYDALRAAGDL